ncbi:hypothetical protein D3C76_1236520 [compost metagenome]
MNQRIEVFFEHLCGFELVDVKRKFRQTGYRRALSLTACGENQTIVSSEGGVAVAVAIPDCFLFSINAFSAALNIFNAQFGKEIRQRSHQACHFFFIETRANAQLGLRSQYANTQIAALVQFRQTRRAHRCPHTGKTTAHN